MIDELKENINDVEQQSTNLKSKLKTAIAKNDAFLEELSLTVLAKENQEQLINELNEHINSA